jgi:hypothetical protein
MRTRLAAALAVIVLVVGGSDAGQAQSAAQRELTIPTVGTASISGVVINDEQPARPVRRAIVTLTASELKPNRGAITDDAGRFTFTRLPAGRFTLTVSRAAYITSAYGAKRPGRPGTPIAVRDGESIADVSLKLWRGAAIAGIVRDDFGAPVEGVPVTAIPARASAAAMTLSNNGTVTNDAGEYRIFGLLPGTYVVLAKPSSTSGAGLRAVSEAEIDAALDSLRRGTTAGPQPQPAPANAPEARRPFDYAPIFAPGTAVLSQAATIVLTAGEEETGVDIAIQRVSTTVVEGSVTRQDGQPAAGGRLQLTATVPPGAYGSLSPTVINATTNADGSFRIGAVPPGDYRVVAQVPVQAPPAPDRQGGVVTPGPPLSLWAAAEISAGGSDVTRLALTVEPGATLTGRIQVEARAGTPAPNLAQLRVGLWPASIGPLKPNTPITQLTAIPWPLVRADGTFEIANVPPDRYRLQLSGPALIDGVWWAESAMLGDRDLLDGDVVVTPGTGLAGVTITLSDRHAELSGALQTTTGAPEADVFVIAFPTNRTFWGAGARRVQAVRPGVDGRFALRLPAGEYHVAAVRDVDEDEWQDPLFLEALVPASLKLALTAGEKKRQDLRIGR